MRVHYRLMRPVRLQAELSIEGFTVLLGNTGVGKTSLLKALAGLLPAEGEPYNWSAPLPAAGGLPPAGLRPLSPSFRLSKCSLSLARIAATY